MGLTSDLQWIAGNLRRNLETEERIFHPQTLRNTYHRLTQFVQTKAVNMAISSRGRMTEGQISAGSRSLAAKSLE